MEARQLQAAADSVVLAALLVRAAAVPEDNVAMTAMLLFAPSSPRQVLLVQVGLASPQPILKQQVSQGSGRPPSTNIALFWLA